MELKNVTETVKNCGFGVFSSEISTGGSVRGIMFQAMRKCPERK
jgi:aspartyl-tRNA synthetase